MEKTFLEKQLERRAKSKIYRAVGDIQRLMQNLGLRITISDINKFTKDYDEDKNFIEIFQNFSKIATDRNLPMFLENETSEFMNRINNLEPYFKENPTEQDFEPNDEPF